MIRDAWAFARSRRRYHLLPLLALFYLLKPLILYPENSMDSDRIEPEPKSPWWPMALLLIALWGAIFICLEMAMLWASGASLK